MYAHYVCKICNPKFQVPYKGKAGFFLKKKGTTKRFIICTRRQFLHTKYLAFRMVTISVLHLPQPKILYCISI